MCKLHEQLKYFVNKKMSSDPAWQEVKVILSGHDVSLDIMFFSFAHFLFHVVICHKCYIGFSRSINRGPQLIVHCFGKTI